MAKTGMAIDILFDFEEPTARVTGKYHKSSHPNPNFVQSKPSAHAAAKEAMQRTARARRESSKRRATKRTKAKQAPPLAFWERLATPSKRDFGPDHPKGTRAPREEIFARDSDRL